MYVLKWTRAVVYRTKYEIGNVYMQCIHLRERFVKCIIHCNNLLFAQSLRLIPTQSINFLWRFCKKNVLKLKTLFSLNLSMFMLHLERWMSCCTLRMRTMQSATFRGAYGETFYIRRKRHTAKSKGKVTIVYRSDRQ